MQKILFSLIMMFAFHLYANDIKIKHNQSKMSSNTPNLVEVVLTLPFDNLIINPDGITVNYAGNLLTVHSLEKSGEQWTVRAGGYCRNGHCIVCKCGGCAVSSCGYCCTCYTDYKKTS